MYDTDYILSILINGISEGTLSKTFNRDPFAVLGIPSSSSKAEIRRAYKLLASATHPDTNKSADADEKMKELNWAYRLASTPEEYRRWTERTQAGANTNARQWTSTSKSYQGNRTDECQDRQYKEWLDEMAARIGRAREEARRRVHNFNRNQKPKNISEELRPPRWSTLAASFKAFFLIVGCVLTVTFAAVGIYRTAYRHVPGVLADPNYQSVPDPSVEAVLTDSVKTVDAYFSRNGYTPSNPKIRTIIEEVMTLRPGTVHKVVTKVDSPARLGVQLDYEVTSLRFDAFGIQYVASELSELYSCYDNYLKQCTLPVQPALKGCSYTSDSYLEFPMVEIRSKNTNATLKLFNIH